VNDISRIEQQVVQFARDSGLNLPPAVVFGDGAVQEAGQIAAGFTRPALAFLVVGSGRAPKSVALQGRLSRVLNQAGCEVVDWFRVDREPDVELVDSATAACRRSSANLIVGCGGGSVLDSAKAVAAMTVHLGSVQDYLEGVGHRTLEHSPLPVLAIPTTAGTGSEVTRNAVVSIPGPAVKRSLRHLELMPRAALIDPELTWTTPPGVTAASGMDALTQLLEPCISKKKRPETTALALRVLPLVAAHLQTCFSRPDARQSRQAMSLASMVSGICLANAGLGLVHGIASGLGALKHVSHGLICAILLPAALAYNRDAAEDELREALAAFLETPPAQTDIQTGIQAIEALKRALGLPENLRFLRLTETEVSAIAERSMGSSMSGNPVPMNRELVEEFLRSVC
jgi:alcohol dehydrogenase class IV